MAHLNGDSIQPVTGCHQSTGTALPVIQPREKVKHALLQAMLSRSTEQQRVPSFPCLVQTTPNRVVPLQTQRPIYPKPPKDSPKACIRKRSKPQPVAVVIAGVPDNPLPYVSFSLYSQGFPTSAVPDYRISYANTVIPRQRLHALGHKNLRLDEVIPKSRLSRRGTQKDFHERDISAPSPYQLSSVFWKCPHTTIVRSAAASDVTSAIPVPSDSALATVDNSVTSPEVKQLRPSARLLVRLGQQLVRSQYDRMTVVECGCGLRAYAEPSDASRAKSVPQDSENDLLVRSESQHLEWQPKPIQQRWIRVRDLCRTHDCPFIPASMFQLHRHLETGHHRLISVPASVGSQSAAVSGVNQTACRKPSKLVVPAVFNASHRTAPFFRCPVCAVSPHSLTSLVSHIKQLHPFITPNPLERSLGHTCGICGQPVGPSLIQGLSRTSLSGSRVHAQCIPLDSAYLHAAWAAYDAHPLACLILYPNHHSRIVLPRAMAAQLYRAMDFVLSSNACRLKLWSLNSCTLRCSLAISALYGDLIEQERKPVIQNSDASAVEATGLSLAPASALPATAPTATPVSSNVGTFAASSLNLDTNPYSDLPPTPLTAQALAQQSVPVDAGSKRPSTTDVFEPASKKPCDLQLRPEVAFDNQQSVTSTSDQDALPSVTVDLTDDQSNSTCESESSNQSPPGSTRCSPLNGVACELCDSLVPFSTYREHLIQTHECELGQTPSEYCSFCGQLFWTPQGCTAHQRVQCVVCSSNGVCQSTIYIHMALKHIEELAASLTINPISCLLCNRTFEHIMPHLMEKHFCTIPADVLSHIPSHINVDLFLNIGFKAFLRDLAPLYIVSMSTIRTQLRYTRSLPNNVIQADANDSSLLLFKCSTCHLDYISAAQLDLHMVQSNHECWCSTCRLSCHRIRDLVNHDSTRCAVPKRRSLKFIRIDSLENGRLTRAVVTYSSKIPAVVASVASQSDKTIPHIRTTMAPLSQFHGCDLCPVFCLTMEDLDTHRQTAHNCDPLRRFEPAACIAPANLMNAPAIDNVNAPPTQTVFATGSQPGKSALVHSSPHVLPCTVSYQPVVRPTVSIMPSVLPVQPVLIVPGPPPVSQPNVEIPQSSKEAQPSGTKAEELVCPMCEFQSTDRNTIMKHITDVH